MKGEKRGELLVQYSGRMRRRVGALTVWFKIPEQGMKKFEVLSQGSCVPILMKVGAPPVVATSSHTTQPWAWREYYNQSWLDFVKPEHAKYTLDIISDDGVLRDRYLLERDSLFSHPVLDVSLLTMATSEIARYDTEKPLISSKLSTLTLKDEDDSELIMEGLPIDESEQEGPEGDGFRRQSFKAIENCFVLACTPERVLTHTPLRVLPGMSGGGVFDVNGDCMGIIEAEIKGDNPNDEDAFFASFITSAELSRWMSSAGDEGGSVTSESRIEPLGDLDSSKGISR